MAASSQRTHILEQCASVALLVLIVAGVYLAYRPATPPNVSFRLLGPQGDQIVVQLPQLMKVPALDLPMACAKVTAFNRRARSVTASPNTRDDAEDDDVVPYADAEAGCAAGADRGYKFYDNLGDLLDESTPADRSDANQLVAAMREALRTATTPGEVSETLSTIDSRINDLADRLQEPDFFLIGAEVLALRVSYCVGKDATACRANVNARRGEDLFDAGRWRADPELLRASIKAYREALRDAVDRSDRWVDLHTQIGSALGQLSEQQSDSEQRLTLHEALTEYEQAADAVEPSDHPTRALIDQNVCSIRQPLAALEHDRAGTKLAIDECERARAYYKARDHKINEAAAHYNMARAYETLAEWDHDEAAALLAVEHVRESVRLYAAADAVLSRAFGQVHLASALLDAADYAKEHPADREQSRALYAEARASLDAAEPVLRQARATGYLQSLNSARGRLAGAEQHG